MAGPGLTHRVWLERIPDLVAECRAGWELRLGEPYVAGAGGYTVRAELTDGTPAVLKLIYPHRESEHEAAALAAWDGNGVVKLLERDDTRNAMLLERCDPGTPLSELGAHGALDVIAGLLPRLWQRVDGPFRMLADEAAWWASYLPGQWERTGRPFERKLLDAALDALEQLPATQGETVLVNQDLHAENVLAAQREPWLVIDPKPLVGEREFGLAPLVRGSELGGTRADVLHRLERLSAELGLDRERARGWSIAQTLAWALNGDWREYNLDVVRWLVEAA